MVISKTKQKVTGALLNTFFILLCCVFVLPMCAVISVSLASDEAIVTYGYSFFPRVIDFGAYEYIFKSPARILSAYRVTIIMSALGTGLYLLMAGLCAYALSRRNFIYRGKITFYLFFTMLFSGGLVPSYILVTKYLNLKDTIWALILPSLGNVWYLFLMRTFFSQIPGEILESATVDGASELTIFFRMVVPLSTPVIATVGLFQLLNFWNSWYSALLYIEDKNLYPLQYLLQVMLRNIQEILNSMKNEMISPDNLALTRLPTDSVRMAMCLLAAGPMLLVFPFFQKYFARGMTIGSVKG